MKRDRLTKWSAASLTFLLLSPQLLAQTKMALPLLPPPPPPSAAAPVSQPTISGRDPVVRVAAEAIYDAYRRYDVVAMSAAHGNQNLDNFILELLSNPRFPGKINDIVVECGNSLYQSELDHYIAGDPVSLVQIQKVWRNTTQPMCGVSAFYQELFPLIRRLNQRLPVDQRVRVLASDVPVDWSDLPSQTDPKFQFDRDETIADIMEREVLSKHHKALVLMGVDHLYHGALTADMPPSAVARYEKKYPNRTLVVADHGGFGNGTPYAEFNSAFEKYLVAWPVPALATNIRGSWLDDILNKTQSLGVVTLFHSDKSGHLITQNVTLGQEQDYADMVDAYLYLAPRDLLLNETVPANVFLEQSYMAEMRRRATLMGGPSTISDQANPAKVLESYEVFFEETQP